MAVLVKYSFQITSLQLVLGREEQNSSEFRNSKKKSVLNVSFFPWPKGAEPCWDFPGRTDHGLWAAALIQQVASEHPQAMPHLGTYGAMEECDHHPASILVQVPAPHPSWFPSHRGWSAAIGAVGAVAVLCCAVLCRQLPAATLGRRDKE